MSPSILVCVLGELGGREAGVSGAAQLLVELVHISPSILVYEAYIAEYTSTCIRFDITKYTSIYHQLYY